MKKLINLSIIVILTMFMISACTSPVQSNNAQVTSSQKVTLTILDESLQAEEYVIAFKKGNTQLHNSIMSEFYSMIKDGKAAEISEKWFGKDIIFKPEENNLTSLEYPKDKKTFIMGLDDSFPPMGYRDEDNNIVGFDIDLATEVCSRLGVELILQPIDWATKELELSTGNIDCIWNGLTKTSEREEAMLLSSPYLANNQVIVVKDSSQKMNKSNLEGKKIGVQTGSSAEEALRKDEINSKIDSVVQYADNVTALQDLKIGRIDAVVIDEVVARYYISLENNK